MVQLPHKDKANNRTSPVTKMPSQIMQTSLEGCEPVLGPYAEVALRGTINCSHPSPTGRSELCVSRISKGQNEVDEAFRTAPRKKEESDPSFQAV